MKGLTTAITITLVSILYLACSPSMATPPDYDVTRLSAEIEAFEAFDRTARYRPDGVVFTGSSGIRLWPELGSVMAPVPSLNRGFGGSTIPEVNHYYDRIVTKFRPSIIVLYCGENDLWMGRTVDDVVKDYMAFVKKTKEVLPDTKIVYLSIKPSPSRWSKWNLYEEGNNMIKALTERDDDQYYVDISTYMLDDQGNPISSIFMEDQLHMNEQGYEGWKTIVRPVIQNLYNQ